MEITAKKNIFWIILTTSGIALSVALTAEYVFGLKPCILCLYERIPYLIAFLLAIFSKFLPKKHKLILYLCLSCFIGGTALSFYHIGVEHNIFKGTDKCHIEKNLKPTTIEDLQLLLNDQSTPACNRPEFTFLSISFAGWNLILSVIMSFIIFISIKRYSYDKS